MKTALVLIHEKYEGPGLIGDVLNARGFGVRLIYTPEESVTTFDAIEPDLVVVMGGPMGVYEREDYPFLKEEIDFIKKRILFDKPTLGICLGSQLIAAALGEEVFKGKAGQEIGWNKLVTLAEDHPVRHLSGEATNMFHWHGDTFNLPKGAVLLASTDMYPSQIYSFGKNTMALQCHPEVTPDMAEEWIEEMGAQVSKSKICMGLDDLRAQTKENMMKMNQQSKLFFNEWLETVGL